MTSIKTLFLKGAYTDIVEAHHKKRLLNEDRPWLVGALCFQGKLTEALELTKETELVPEEELFLCIGHTRLSQYSNARTILNRLKKKSKSSGYRFFFFQAAAFYCYYLGRFQIARSLAQKSYLASLKLNETIWKFFAIDLIGHAFVQCGDIHAGIESLREGALLSRTLGNKTLVQAAEISILSYESQFTTNPEEHKTKLRVMLRRLARTDNYSEGNLLLNLVHLELLTGNMSEAENVLMEAQKVIFGKNLARYMGAWQFERSYSYFLSGLKRKALEELASAKSKLNLRVERKLHLKILGLEAKILEGFGEDVREHQRVIQELSQFIGDPSSLNKLARMMRQKPVKTQDPLQSLYDEFHGSEWAGSIYKIVKNGYFGILREKITVNQELLLIRGLWNKGLIFISPEQIHFVEKNVGRLPLMGLLALFENEELSKEKLVTLMWGYEYDPARHDALLYALIHRIRGLMGPFQTRLSGSDHHYRIEGSKKVLNLETEKKIRSAAEEGLPVGESWNIRQYQIQNLMQDGKFWSVGEYAEHFNVTTMTAFRDLKLLMDMRLITKLGNGRGTKYGILKKD